MSTPRAPIARLVPFVSLLSACTGGKVDNPVPPPGDESTPADETVTPPGAPSAPAVAYTQIVHETWLDGAASSLGHDLEYRVDWGDGRVSEWAATAEATVTWTAPGTYSARAQARCVDHPEVVSDWSETTDWVVRDSATAPHILFPPAHEQAFADDGSTVETSEVWAIVVGTDPPPLVSKAAEWLTEKLAALGVTCETLDQEPQPQGSRPVVLLSADGSLDGLDAEQSAIGLAPVAEMQGYVLAALPGPRVVIAGADAAGVLYGCTSLMQIVHKSDDTHV
ncbi:glycoside hydrolase family 20 zincin-like fold domain-containing protein, partial [Myxococcota bacterium]